MADTKNFTEAVIEEVVNTLMNQYELSEPEANKKAKKWNNAIEADMWNAFDRFIEEKMAK